MCGEWVSAERFGVSQVLLAAGWGTGFAAGRAWGNGLLNKAKRADMHDGVAPGWAWLKQATQPAAIKM